MTKPTDQYRLRWRWHPTGQLICRAFKTLQLACEQAAMIELDTASGIVVGFDRREGRGPKCWKPFHPSPEDIRAGEDAVLPGLCARDRHLIVRQHPKP